MLDISKCAFGVDGVQLAPSHSAGDVSFRSLSTGAWAMTWMDVGRATATREERWTTSESQPGYSPVIIHLSEFRFVCNHNVQGLMCSGGGCLGPSFCSRKWQIFIAARGDRGIHVFSMLSSLRLCHRCSWTHKTVFSVALPAVSQG